MQDDITVETIHAAKGKTYEAVLFVVSDNRSKKGTAKQLGELPDGHEEIRTAYVAMTRPRKLLVVAVPKETDRSYLKRFPKWMKTNIPGQLSLNI
jgi:superfamily I DNA/RNA helicase